MRIFSIVLIVVISILACNRKQAAVDSQKVAMIPSFAFSAGSCFGFCPIFDIILEESGEAIYVGKDYAHPSGIHSRMLSSAEKIQYLDLVNDINWDTIPEIYETPVADAPHYYFEYNDDVKTRVSFEYPESLKKLKNFFFEVQKSGEWKKSEHPAYDETQKNNAAICEAIVPLDLKAFQEKHSFLKDARVIAFNEGKILSVELQNSNLDYKALKESLLRTNQVKNIEPVYWAKKKPSK